MTIGAAELVKTGLANEQFTTHGTPAALVNTKGSFDQLKQIDASVLNVGYAESGPANGPVVILLHGNADTCREAIPGDRSLFTRLWNNPLSFRQHSRRILSH